MAKHLPAHGWRTIVIRAHEDHYTELPDARLAERVPKDLEQVRTAALPARLTRCFGIGDLGLRGLPYFARALMSTIKAERPDVIFLTGSPFYPLALSAWLKRRFDVPVVIDLQDPWVSAYGARQPGWSKRGLAHRMALVLEPMALRYADQITSVSEVQNEELARRYPWLDRRRLTALPIGGDPEDFDALREGPPAGSAVQLDTSKVNLNYVGTFLPGAALPVRVLFRAAAQLAADRPALASKLRFNFVGTSNQSSSVGQLGVTSLALEEGVEGLVSEVPQRVPYLEALSLLAVADGILLIGSDEPHYTASKIYPALMSGRPFLSLFHSSSSSHDIMSRAGGGRALAFTSPRDLEALQPRLIDALVALATNPGSFPKPDAAVFAPFTANAIAGQFAALFSSTLAKASPWRAS